MRFNIEKAQLSKMLKIVVAVAVHSQFTLHGRFIKRTLIVTKPTVQQNFFTETALTPERKVEKSFPMWEINRHAEG